MAACSQEACTYIEAHGGTHKHSCVHTNKLSHWAMHTQQKNKILGESFLNVGIFFPLHGRRRVQSAAAAAAAAVRMDYIFVRTSCVPALCLLILR